MCIPPHVKPCTGAFAVSGRSSRIACSSGSDARSYSPSALSTTASKSTDSPHALVHRPRRGDAVRAKAIRLHGNALASPITWLGLNSPRAPSSTSRSVRRLPSWVNPWSRGTPASSSVLRNMFGWTSTWIGKPSAPLPANGSGALRLQEPVDRPPPALHGEVTPHAADAMAHRPGIVGQGRVPADDRRPVVSGARADGGDRARG